MLGIFGKIQILRMLTLTFNCGFLCALGLQKLQKTPLCNYILIKVTKLYFTKLFSKQREKQKI